MKAARINEYGDASAITVSDIEQPSPKAGQVLVEVHAASLNPFDSAIRSGYLKDMIPLELPFTLAGDIAGVVSELGEGVKEFAVGDKVYGQAAVVAGNSGALAEYAATSSGQIAKAPNELDFKHAASLPLVGVSALQALTQHIELRAGQRIFIHGGAGGIGTIAIQIAKNIGAYVATTASTDHAEFVKELGADEVIDYKSQDFAKLLQGFDAVFDTVGGDDFAKSLSTLKEGGIAVSMIAQPDEAKAAELGVSALYQQTHVTTEALNNLRDLVEGGVVKPLVDQVFPLENIQEAFTVRETSSVPGKIVVSIK